MGEMLSWNGGLSSKTEGESRCRFEIEVIGSLRENIVKLTILHEADHPSKMINAVSKGWPQILSSLKSLLETGAALPWMESSHSR